MTTPHEINLTTAPSVSDGISGSTSPQPRASATGYRVQPHHSPERQRRDIGCNNPTESARGRGRREDVLALLSQREGNSASFSTPRLRVVSGVRVRVRAPIHHERTRSRPTPRVAPPARKAQHRCRPRIRARTRTRTPRLSVAGIASVVTAITAIAAGSISDPGIRGGARCVALLLRRVREVIREVIRHAARAARARLLGADRITTPAAAWPRATEEVAVVRLDGDVALGAHAPPSLVSAGKVAKHVPTSLVVSGVAPADDGVSDEPQSQQHRGDQRGERVLNFHALAERSPRAVRSEPVRRTSPRSAPATAQSTRQRTRTKSVATSAARVAACRSRGSPAAR